MLENLSESIRDCYQHVEHCERQAAQQINPVLQNDFLDMPERWRRLASSNEFAERLTRFTAQSR